MGQESLEDDIQYIRSIGEQFLDEYLKIVNDLTIDDEENKTDKGMDDEQTIYTQYTKEIVHLKRQIEEASKKTK